MKTFLSIICFCISKFAIAQVAGGPIAFYRMDGDATDASQYRNHGSIFGRVEAGMDRFGNPCGALKFDGITGYISVPSSASLKRPQSAYTVAVWVRMESNSLNPSRKWLTVCCKSNLTVETFNNPQFRVQSMQDDAKGYNTISVNTDFTEPATENLVLNQWFFYVLCYDGRQVNAYIDGKNVFSFSYSKMLSPNDLPLEICRDMPGGVEYFCGTMDDLRIYDRALSTDEILKLYKDASGKGTTSSMGIKCPADVIKTASNGNCGILVDYIEPTVNVDCGSATISHVAGLPSGSNFPIGETTVTYVASENSGNTASCSFTVRVSGSNFPTIQCPKPLVVACEANSCSATVRYSTPTVNSPCSAPLLTRINGQPSGFAFGTGENMITYHATDLNGSSAECQFVITVRDLERPKIQCPTDMQVDIEGAAAEARVSYNDPSFSDNCPSASLTRISGPVTGSAFPIGSTTVTYQVHDAAGNTATCSFAVVVDKIGHLGITCPSDILVSTDAGQCSATVAFNGATPTGNLPDVTVAQTSGAKSGSKIPIGSHTISFSAAHPSGKQADCSFKIMVRDTEKPIVKCPNNVHLMSKYGSEGAIFEFEEPIVSDNCRSAELNQTSGSKLGNMFPIGATTVSFEAKDAAGNTGDCSFLVSVIEEETQLPSKIDKDSIVYQKDLIEVASARIRVYYYDNQDQDGDTISLNFNGKWVVDYQKILHKKKVLENNRYIDFDLEPNKVHYLISKAWNEGKKPTNTLTIEIVDGVSLPRILNLTSTIGKSSAIKIQYKK